jgi:uncharacterized protein (TIGR00730 family)
MQRLCVFAGAGAGRREVYAETARRLGRLLGERRMRLVYGAARIGVMGVLADAALAAGVHVTGVIPEALVTKEVAHDGLSDLRIVGSMHERKALMADLSDGFLALPGGWGTLEELFEVLTWAQLGFHRKPCAILNAGGYFDGLLAFLRHAVEEGFVTPAVTSMLLVDDDPASLLDRMAAYRSPVVTRWIDREAT